MAFLLALLVRLTKIGWCACAYLHTLTASKEFQNCFECSETETWFSCEKSLKKFEILSSRNGVIPRPEILKSALPIKFLASLGCI